MLLQQAMIERVRALCQQDERIDAAMMYGSFTHGEGDRFSDIEFVFFVQDGPFAELNRRAWLQQIAPVALLYVNDFGIDAVIFENLVRGEFHFHRRSEMSLAAAWRAQLPVARIDARGRQVGPAYPLSAAAYRAGTATRRGRDLPVFGG
jgi:lincosamide nucleotidyltransferase